MQWYITALKRYADFSGRSRRKEFWLFILFHFLVSLILNVIGIAIDMQLQIGLAMALPGLYGLATIIPALAVTVRRLHDINRTGWWILIGFVPAIGAIVLLVFHVQEGDVGENQYGPNPKADEGMVGATA